MLSYRGPSAPGGVSNALTQIYNNEDSSFEWWFLNGNAVQRKSAAGQQSLGYVSETLLDNHYRYCNNFLWPVLHDLPQFAHYSDQERQCYRSFNAVVAGRLRESIPPSDQCFVNDYQFALIPSLMRGGERTFVFWHIPWPANVYEEHTAAIAELALGLLNADTIGFHTQEYADNFQNFVRKNLRQTANNLVVAPLGIDNNLWHDLSNSSERTTDQGGLPCILSVDRCDYTKGIAERLNAIDIFFEHHPQWRSQVYFHQIGTRSREGLTEFDSYWQRCRQQAESINARWSANGWQPLVWTEQSKVGADLAAVYAKADVMLVNPLRDGLNLTAKEFIACQRSTPGVLALSADAGVWHELKDGAVAVNPRSALNMANTIDRCLRMSHVERYGRNLVLKERLEHNDISDWWQRFKDYSSLPTPGTVAQKVCS